jgi:hypothetical protein
MKLLAAKIVTAFGGGLFAGLLVFIALTAVGMPDVITYPVAIALDVIVSIKLGLMALRD